MARIYLNTKQKERLVADGVLLQPVQIVDKIFKETGLDVSVKLRVRVVDYTKNRFAPENYGYSLSWECQYTGKRDRCMYYPNTVGFQG